MPFCHLRIKALRCPHPHRWKCTQIARATPETIGDHIKRRRLQFHVMQADLARRLGVHKGTLQNWERNRGTPTPANLPGIISFLGYVPFAHDGSPGSKARSLRLCAGWTQEELAAAAGCNGVTVWRWEMDQPFDRRLRQRGLDTLRGRLKRLGLLELKATDCLFTYHCD